MEPERPIGYLSAFDIGYICGLIVGEGSFTGDRKQASLAVKLHVDDELPLRYLLRVLGGNLYGPYNHDNRRYYLWRLSGFPLRDALPLFQVNLPESRKRRQFESWRIRYKI